ncbi:hypothetical protein BO78DRAFT_425991 [Aspergillus sclerotiicarbonarius CBS 121057]|uniref:Uncharacterized protein n=1 Tax=Aspergillus sclerotiicarbonarius (strain CBS 121057 / IBT 28362) TaxID=1448318 RepID=A0A319EMC6_ASPSB|nr:hypothetical protein BO78DRAFT_425991 [Aspergillus sclerotiicarbonarius CBS 121057]
MQTANPLCPLNPQPSPNYLNPLYQFHPQLGGEITGELSPYFAGNRIVLRLHRNTGKSQIVVCRIIHVFEPFDTACVVAVSIERPPIGLEGMLVVKMFDRRFATAQRLKHGCAYWSRGIEAKYREFTRGRESSMFLENMGTRVPSEEEQKHWRVGRREAHITAVMQKYYMTEMETYRRVRELQGTYIPWCFGTVHLSWEASDIPGNAMRWSSPGLLLQYITGFPLERLAYHMPRQAWEGIRQDATNVVSILRSRGLQNLDATPKNLVVWSCSPRGPFKVIMVNLVLRDIHKSGMNDLVSRAVNTYPGDAKPKEQAALETLGGGCRFR